MDAANPTGGQAACASLTIRLRGTDSVIAHEAGETIVQAAFAANLRPPISCLQGQCATCMARLEKGTVTMLANDVLTPDEVAQGYILTCQAVPTSAEVVVVYE